MLKIYTVFDAAVQAYGQPFFCRANGEAIRTFSDAVNDSQSAFFKHPNDFALYALGEFDQSSGAIVAQPPLKLVSATDVVNSM